MNLSTALVVKVMGPVYLVELVVGVIPLLVVDSRARSGFGNGDGLCRNGYRGLRESESVGRSRNRGLGIARGDGNGLKSSGGGDGDGPAVHGRGGCGCTSVDGVVDRGPRRGIGDGHDCVPL
jgi:hypothetical protein